MHFIINMSVIPNNTSIQSYQNIYGNVPVLNVALKAYRGVKSHEIVSATSDA